MTSVKQVRVEVVLDNGTTLHFVRERPGPRGDNHLFLVQQFQRGLEEVVTKMENAIKGAFPGQIVPESQGRMFEEPLSTFVGDLPEFGRQVRMRRQLLSLDQNHLAIVSGVTQSTISRIESGSEAISEHSRNAIAFALDNMSQIAKDMEVSRD